MRRLLALFAIGLFFGAPSSVMAQGDLRVTVEVTQKKAPLAGAPVFLRAARPKGPFEPKDPKPAREWSGVTNASGQAIFDKVPRSLATQGLRLHAVTIQNGATFKSAVEPPTNNLKLSVPIYERGFDPGTVRVQNLRTVVEPWEGYLVFSQMWILGIEGDKALDTSLLSDPKYERGLPLELPLKAQGIKVLGASYGTHKTVNSTVYWQGVLKPGAPMTVQLRFSMAAKDADFVFEQTMAYPTQQYDVLVPLETRYPKIPRLGDLELRSHDLNPGKRDDITGLRQDRTFVIAIGRDVPVGKRLRYQLRGLPYARSQTPWVVLILGILGAIGILWYARRDHLLLQRSQTRDAVIESLIQEREELFADLLLLEKELSENVLTAREYEQESQLIREQLALIMQRLETMQAQAPA